MQVILYDKNMKPRILYDGVIITFAQKMLNFNINQTNLLIVPGEMFLTLEMLKNMGICKR